MKGVTVDYKCETCGVTITEWEWRDTGECGSCFAQSLNADEAVARAEASMDRLRAIKAVTGDGYVHKIHGIYKDKPHLAQKVKGRKVR